LRTRLAEIEERLNTFCYCQGPNDERNVFFVEGGPGTGVTRRRSSLEIYFACTAKYAERQGLAHRGASENLREHGGYKEVIARVEGRAYMRG